MVTTIIIAYALACAISSTTVLAATNIKAGVGIWDMTGPAAEINFMGYAVPNQRGQGILQRLRARAFTFCEDQSEKESCVSFVSVDGGMASDLVKMKVLDRLDEKLGKGVYTNDNLCISGTHTHSGPAGFLQYVLFQVTSFGFVQETFDAWVDGISNAVAMAHQDRKEADLSIVQDLLFDSNINRSPSSYLLNPADERAQYSNEGDTDKNMLLLKIASADNKKLMGVVNWFAVHGTSMNNTNVLINGDNKGYASYSLERMYNGAEVMPGKGKFVAAFASTNLGDVSPNTNGPKCIDTGLDCDGTTSTCNGKCENCIAFGPGTNGDMVESCKIIGDKQVEMAKKLLSDTKSVNNVVGSIDYRHSFVKMSSLNVTLSTGETKTLCSPAMGYSFAAGTTDGPGMFGFTQGTTTGNPFWNKVSSFLSEPTEEEINCQAPKPILLNTGDIGKPYEWDPKTVPVQILKVGNLYILSAPSEFTTMAGRRLRSAVKSVLQDYLKEDEEIFITIAGLSNTYSSYVTTYEEYQAQRYEAASTIFGPHTLEGYIQEFTRLARDLATGKSSTTDAPPPDLSAEQLQLIGPPDIDLCSKGNKDESVLAENCFGSVVEGKDALSSYVMGDTVEVTFHAANPRNNQHTQGSYLTVEFLQNNNWKQVAWDGDWDTSFYWYKGKENKLFLGTESEAVIRWNIDKERDYQKGSYRLCYQGDYRIEKDSMKTKPFAGCSSSFSVN